MDYIICCAISGVAGLFIGGYLSYKYAAKLVAKALQLKKDL